MVSSSMIKCKALKDDESAQTAHHLVGKDAVDPVVKEVDQPVEPLQLVLAHLAPLDDTGLHTDPVGHHRSVLVLEQISVLLLLGVLCSVPPCLLAAPA